MGLFSKLFSKKSSITENSPKPNNTRVSQQYIETNHGIQRTDGRPFEDSEVPYLIQLGYEKEMQKRGVYNGEQLDLSFIAQANENKASHTKLPTYDELIDIPQKDEKITSTDIFFLKYINGRTLENPSIAQYWFYEYNLNYSDEIRKLVASNLLTVQNVNIEKLKVDELKAILRNFNLPLTGKKKYLQQRILDNIKLDDLSHFLGDNTHYFSVTEQGASLIENIHESATRNIELEDSCIALIINGDYESAFNLISDFKHNTPAEACSYFEYNDNIARECLDIMNSHSFYYTLEMDRNLENAIRAAVVFCRMYGSGQDNIKKIIKRIYIENGHEFTNDAKNIISGRLL